MRNNSLYENVPFLPPNFGVTSYALKRDRLPSSGEDVFHVKKVDKPLVSNFGLKRIRIKTTTKHAACKDSKDSA